MTAVWIVKVAWAPGCKKLRTRRENDPLPVRASRSVTPVAEGPAVSRAESAKMHWSIH